MAPAGPALHAHAPFKTPHAYVAPMERLDLAMSKDILKKSTNLSYAHLNYLECHGESVFADNNSVNLFVNALRIHWKVSGKTLQNASDQGKDLYELFALGVDGQHVIRNLFTREAIFFLLGRDFPDAMMILAAIVHRIYISQWRSWSTEHTQKNSSQSRYALIISHAQATSNQLSNNVLAFKSNATPELRKWAEETVARHLIAIVTPGHLPRPSARNNKYLPSFHDPMLDSKSVEHTAISPTRLVKYNAAHNNYATESGPSIERYQVPFRPNPSTKRKAPGISPKYHSSPSNKKIKFGTERFRASDIYRPLGYQRAPTNGHGRPSHRHVEDLLTTPTPVKYIDHHEQQALDTPSHEALLKAKLHVLQGKITQHKLDDICVDFADSSLGSNFRSSHEHNTPVVKGPSYTDYLRNKVQDAESRLTVNKRNTAGHVRNKSFVGSEEGEIFD
ncbi:hypothetical protein KCU81_g1634, partial [Aureobasidium melanogenum]|uniref:Uncharacterized protein n=1 Tax=Aureobasidium melanogenum (strain CBS 110374) TaxID=1043003 RepID=A0A074WPE6_AURM1